MKRKQDAWTTAHNHNAAAVERRHSQFMNVFLGIESKKRATFRIGNERVSLTGFNAKTKKGVAVQSFKESNLAAKQKKSKPTVAAGQIIDLRKIYAEKESEHMTQESVEEFTQASVQEKNKNAKQVDQELENVDTWSQMTPPPPKRRKADTTSTTNPPSPPPCAIREHTTTTSDANNVTTTTTSVSNSNNKNDHTTDSPTTSTPPESSPTPTEISSSPLCSPGEIMPSPFVYIPSQASQFY